MIMVISSDVLNWPNAKFPHKKNGKTLRVKIHTGLNWFQGFLNLSNDFLTPSFK